jgi:hypothetical protein
MMQRNKRPATGCRTPDRPTKREPIRSLLVMHAPLFPLIVKRPFFDMFASGIKSVEYRRHKAPFVAKNFWPGRRVRIACRYQDLGAGGRSLLATCEAFEVARVSMLEHDTAALVRAIYPSLGADDEIALIRLRAERD